MSLRSRASALRSGRTRYSAFNGEPALSEAIATYESTLHNRTVTADQVTSTHGGSAGLAATILAVVQPGETVLVPEPTYSLYVDQLAMVGAKTIFIAPGDDGELDAQAIADYAVEARMLILCNPGNPTGLVHSEASLLTVSEALAENPNLILASSA